MLSPLIEILPRAKAVAAVAPSAVSTVPSGEEEAARVAATDVVFAVASSAAGEVATDKW